MWDGLACGARVSRGMNSDVDRDTVKAFRELHFKLAKKDGLPIPIIESVAVNYWIDHNGKLVSDLPPSEN